MFRSLNMSWLGILLTTIKLILLISISTSLNVTIALVGNAYFWFDSTLGEGLLHKLKKDKNFCHILDVLTFEDIAVYLEKHPDQMKA